MVCPNRIVPCEFGCGVRTMFCNRHIKVDCILDCGALVPECFMDQHINAECPNRPVVCPLECGTLGLKASTLDGHMEFICPNRIVPCVFECGARLRYCDMHRKAPCCYGCGSDVPECKMEEHQKVCPCRPVTCDWCGKDDIPSQDLEDHKAECPCRPVTCHQCGEEGIKFCELEYHIAELCPWEPVRIPCCNEPRGCPEAFLEEEHSAKLLHESELCEFRDASCCYGCGFIGLFCNLGEHQDNCPWRTVLCRNCKKMVKLCDREAHEAGECRERYSQMTVHDER